MVKRLTAILLLLAFGVGAASGVPLHSGRDECDMGESMKMMDCCKRARSVGNAPEIQSARLCCAVNCQSGGTNVPASTFRITPPQISPSHPAATPAPSAHATAHVLQCYVVSFTNESPPTYLLNLAFLI